jgi:glyoxylase-like metal-dependent hydrolase (beta-lactamase superfamily II)
MNEVRPADGDPATGYRAADGMGTARAWCVLAPNPSPMTLDGTNTWVIAEPGSSSVLVVDPGPDDEAHLRRVLSVASDGDRRVAQIVLTHRHPDHAAGAARFAELTGAPVGALDPAHRLGSEGFGAGTVLTGAGCELRVVATPGHTTDSLSLVLVADGGLLTGDTVLGRGTTVIAEDGSLGDYLRSLDRLRALAADAGLRVVLPGHGPLLTDPVGVLDYYVAHRRERLDQVRAAMATGARTPAEIVAIVYADVDRVLWPAAEQSVRAQLDYLNGALSGVISRTIWRYLARLRSRSASRIRTERAEICSQPRAAKSARALLTVSRDAPTSCASSSWVRSWWTCRPSGSWLPNRSARSSRFLATRPGTSVNTRSAVTSLARRSR